MFSILLLVLGSELKGSTTTATPRSAYPGAPTTTIKGTQRPAMTSPAGGLSGAPYRGTGGWTPQGYTPQQTTYRFTAPLAQPAYAAYTTQNTAVSFYLLLYYSLKFTTSTTLECVFANAPIF